MFIKSELISLLNDVLKQTARLRKGGTQLVYHCPLCERIHFKKKLEICLEDGNKFGIWNCWICRQSGNLGKLFTLLKVPQSYRDKLYLLTKDIRVIRKKQSVSLSTEVILPEEFIPLSKPTNSVECKNAMVYLKRRGVLWEDILRYNIGYCKEGPYEQHIIIPSYDAKGIINFFIGRRYYKTEGIITHKKPDVSMEHVVGFESFINYDEPLILVEGAFNAITIRRNAIPLFGKLPSKSLYMAMLIHNVTDVYVCLDADAEKDAISICKRLLRLGITPHMVKLHGGKDANEIGFDKTWQCIKDAKKVDFQFLLRDSLKL